MSKAKPVSHRTSPGFGSRIWERDDKSVKMQLNHMEHLREFPGPSSMEWQETAGQNFRGPLMKRVLRCLDLVIKWNKTNIP